jgi:hypothetical protein
LILHQKLRQHGISPLVVLSQSFKDISLNLFKRFFLPEVMLNKSDIKIKLFKNIKQSYFAVNQILVVNQGKWIFLAVGTN